LFSSFSVPAPPEISPLSLHDALPISEGRLWRDSGVYLITGGAGGLGLVVAEAIAHQTRGARLVLTGRSEPGAHVLGRLDRLRAEAGRGDYVRADVTDARRMAEVVGGVEQEHGAVHGVFHCAGTDH